jgi:hypothetical protein
MRPRAFAEDRRLLGEVKKMNAMALQQRQRKAYSIIKDRSPNNAMTEVRPLDDTSLDPMSCREQLTFADQLGANGAHIVEELDDGCCVSAFRSWCKQFGIVFDEIERLHGGDWLLEKKLRFSLFRRCLYGMPRGKVMDEGGASLNF